MASNFWQDNISTDETSESEDEEECDNHVQAAVSLVTLFAQQGIVQLCAAVAHLIRDNRRLKKLLKDGASTISQQELAHSLLQNASKVSEEEIFSPRIPIQNPDGQLEFKNRQKSRNRSFTSREFSDSESSQDIKVDSQFCRRNRLVQSYNHQDRYKRRSGNSDSCHTYDLSMTNHSTFVRRNYRTISLIKMRNHIYNKSFNLKERTPKKSDNKTDIVTVADVHSTSMEDPNDNLSFNSELVTTTNIFENSYFPLSGCQCHICLEMLKDHNTEYYVLKAVGSTLLPSGSRLLLKNGQIGTVLYVGHEDTPNDDNSSSSSDVNKCIGVSVLLENNSKQFFTLDFIDDILADEISVIDLSSDSSCQILDEVCPEEDRNINNQSENQSYNIHSKQSGNFSIMNEVETQDLGPTLDKYLNINDTEESFTSYKEDNFISEKDDYFISIPNDNFMTNSNLNDSGMNDNYFHRIDINRGSQDLENMEYNGNQLKNENIMDSIDSGIRVTMGSDCPEYTNLFDRVASSLRGYTNSIKFSNTSPKSSITKRNMYFSERESEV